MLARKVSAIVKLSLADAPPVSLSVYMPQLTQLDKSERGVALVLLWQRQRKSFFKLIPQRLM